MNSQQVIDDARPMLEDILPQIGFYRSGEPLDLIALRDSFSAWAQAQEASDADFAFMASLIGAYISEYLIDARGASMHLLENKIFVRVPFEGGIAREFDPYAAAAGLVRNRQSLSEFLAHV
jgi:hypothetical protein